MAKSSSRGLAPNRRKALVRALANGNALMDVEKGRVHVRGREDVIASFGPKEIDDLAAVILVAGGDTSGGVDWLNSSSMYNSRDYGWPNKSAADDIDAALARLERGFNPDLAQWLNDRGYVSGDWPDNLSETVTQEADRDIGGGQMLDQLGWPIID